MQVKTCWAGYPLPIGIGRMEILGLRATVNDATAASRITLIDDMELPRGATLGRILAEDNQKLPIMDAVGLANTDAVLEITFTEPVKTLRGISVLNAQNLEGGKVMLYVR